MSEVLNGGCHCGAVRFKVQIETRLAYECNCSICHQKGFLHVIVPKESFELERGQDCLRCYTFGTHTAKHLFCKSCGVQSYYVPRSHPEGISVNLRCLDGIALNDFVIETFDGKHWEQNIEAIRNEAR